MDLNTLAHAPDVLNTPLRVFITNAMPSSSKGWWDYFCEGARAVVPFAVVYVAWQQWKLSEEQKEISETQKEIARGKLKLEVFEKRYFLYKELKDNLTDFISKIYNGTHEDLKDLYNKFLSISHEFSFIYSNKVSFEVTLVGQACFEIKSQKRECEANEINCHEYIKT